MKIKERVEKSIEDIPKVPPQWTKQLGEWLTSMRMEGVKFNLKGEQRKLIFNFKIFFAQILFRVLILTEGSWIPRDLATFTVVM